MDILSEGLRGYKDKRSDGKTIGPFVVPPQGVAYTRTEGRRTNNLRTWFGIGFDFLSKSCLTSQTYFKEPYLHVVLLPPKSLRDHL